MAAIAACKRVGQIGISSGVNVTRFRGFGASERTTVCDPSPTIQLSASLQRNVDCRHISQLITSSQKRLFLVDTLALVITYFLCIIVCYFC